jgi:hypothetical protein
MGRKAREKLERRMRGAPEPRPPMGGYVIIDKQGRIRTRQVDRRFGENVGMIVRALRQAKSQT